MTTNFSYLASRKMSSWLQNQFKAAEGLLEAVDRTAKNASKKELAEQSARGAEDGRSNSFSTSEHGVKPSYDDMNERKRQQLMAFAADSRRTSARNLGASPARSSPGQVIRTSVDSRRNVFKLSPKLKLFLLFGTALMNHLLIVPSFLPTLLNIKQLSS